MAGVGEPLRMRSVITPEARLTLFQGAERGELFDLSADPAEMNSLFAKPEATELKLHLMERLTRLQTQHDDCGRGR